MDSMNKQLSSIPNWAKVTAFASVPAAAGFAAARFIDGYHSWLSLGPGGLPSNIKGFLINLILTFSIAQRDTKSLDVYDRPDKTAGWKESTDEEKSKGKQPYLEGELPPRTGPESFAVHWVAPQRELKLNQYSDPKVKEVRLPDHEILALVLMHTGLSQSVSKH